MNVIYSASSNRQIHFNRDSFGSCSGDKECYTSSSAIGFHSGHVRVHVAKKVTLRLLSSAIRFHSGHVRVAKNVTFRLLSSAIRLHSGHVRVAKTVTLRLLSSAIGLYSGHVRTATTATRRLLPSVRLLQTHHGASSLLSSWSQGAWYAAAPILVLDLSLLLRLLTGLVVFVASQWESKWRAQ